MAFAFGGLFLLIVLLGYFAPNSIPGKFVWGFLNVLGMAGDNYKAAHSIANYRAANKRKASEIGRGAENAGDYEALIQSRTREKGTLMDEADELEDAIDQLDNEGVSDDHPFKSVRGERLLQIQDRLAKINEDLNRYGSTQANTLALLRRGKEDVINGERRERELTEDYKASQTEVALARSTASFHPDSGHDTQKEAEDLVQQQIDKNRGRARVFQDVMGDSSGEDQALKDRITARKTKDFLAQRRAQKAGGAPGDATSMSTTT